MPECALCDERFLLRTSSREHVILNAIGGRKKVKGFLCEPCNSRSGHTWDADLAKQLNGLSLFFSIDRERGPVTSQEFRTSSGKSIIMTENSLQEKETSYKAFIIDGRVDIKIQARTLSDARKMLNGLKRNKYPNINVEDAISKAVKHESYLDDMIKFEMQLGGQGSGRSMVKSALALASAAGVSIAHCEEAKRYLRSGEDACFGYYYTRNLVQNRPERTVIHCVSVKSTPDGLLLGYIEFFSIFKIVVCLSKHYSGINVDECYAIDPHTRKVINVHVDLDFSLSDIDFIKAYGHYTAAGIEQALHQAIPVGLQRSTDREWKSVMTKGMKSAWDNCGAQEGETLTPEHYAVFAREFAEIVAPMMIHFRRLGLQPSPNLLGRDDAPE